LFSGKKGLSNEKQHTIIVNHFLRQVMLPEGRSMKASGHVGLIMSISFLALGIFLLVGDNGPNGIISLFVGADSAFFQATWWRERQYHLRPHLHRAGLFSSHVGNPLFAPLTTDPVPYLLSSSSLGTVLFDGRYLCEWSPILPTRTRVGLKDIRPLNIPS
jgi:hypothetical protein